MTQHVFDSIDEWLVDYLATQLGVDKRAIPRDKPFDTIGVDSLLAVTVTTEIKRRFGVKLKATALYEHNTVASLSRCVQEKMPQSA